MVLHHFLEELCHIEALFAFPWMALWIARLPQLAVVNLLPGRYTVSGTACRIESSTWEVRPSVTKADCSSPELVREATFSSVSLVEMLTTLLEDVLALPLDFCS